MTPTKDRMEELCKEVFARFGAAYYFSDCLHRGLCLLFTYTGFESRQHVTRPRIEEKLKRSFSMTLGQAVEAVQHDLPKTLLDDLRDAVGRRNFLAHYFWFERIHLMTSEAGLAQLTAELAYLRDLFEELDNDVMDLVRDKGRRIGIDDSIVQRELTKVMADEPFEPLHEQRFPKKQELVTTAYRVPASDGTFRLVFQTDDNCLWQLCDVGLGWSNFAKPEKDWIIDKRIQEYLPAQVNPRPPADKPWHYSIGLSKGMALQVSRDEASGSLRYAVVSHKGRK